MMLYLYIVNSLSLYQNDRDSFKDSYKHVMRLHPKTKCLILFAHYAHHVDICNSAQASAKRRLYYMYLSPARALSLGAKRRTQKDQAYDKWSPRCRKLESTHMHTSHDARSADSEAPAQYVSVCVM